MGGSGRAKHGPSLTASEAASAGKHYSRRRDMMLMALTHNIMIVRRLDLSTEHS